MNLMMEECLEVTLLDLDDNRSFPSCSVFLIHLWILFLNDIIFSSMSSNQSSSCSCIPRGSKKFYSLCISISLLNTLSIWSICSLTVSIFLIKCRSLSTALDFLSNLGWSFLLSSSSGMLDSNPLAYFFSSQVLFQPICF